MVYELARTIDTWCSTGRADARNALAVKRLGRRRVLEVHSNKVVSLLNVCMAAGSNVATPNLHIRAASFGLSTATTSHVRLRDATNKKEARRPPGFRRPRSKHSSPQRLYRRRFESAVEHRASPYEDPRKAADRRRSDAPRRAPECRRGRSRASNSSVLQRAINPQTLSLV